MDLNLKMTGLDEVSALIAEAQNQASELCDTAAKIHRALAELGIEIDQPAEDTAS